jgi:hypothetical protein
LWFGAPAVLAAIACRYLRINPTGGGPARDGQVGLGGAGQNEPARARIVIDSPFDRAEDFGDQLPLVDENRLVEAAECGVGVGANDRGLSGDIQP